MLSSTVREGRRLPYQVLTSVSLWKPARSTTRQQRSAGGSMKDGKKDDWVFWGGATRLHLCFPGDLEPGAGVADADLGYRNVNWMRKRLISGRVRRRQQRQLEAPSYRWSADPRCSAGKRRCSPDRPRPLFPLRRSWTPSIPSAAAAAAPPPLEEQKGFDAHSDTTWRCI